MNPDLADFREFIGRREKAARAYACGDASPLGALLPERSQATFFAPDGALVQGADAVAAAYRQGATAFESGGDSRLEVLHIEARDGLAFWAGIQHATVRLRGRAGLTAMRLRVSEAFRREGGEWKLVHRHADEAGGSGAD